TSSAPTSRSGAACKSSSSTWRTASGCYRSIRSRVEHDAIVGNASEGSARPLAPIHGYALMPTTYRGMARQALDAAYDNAGAVADSQGHRARWLADSAAIRAEPTSRRDIRYGARARATLDYFPCGIAHRPLFVFIHGGYWQRNEKERFAFVAKGPRAHG